MPVHDKYVKGLFKKILGDFFVIAGDDAADDLKIHYEGGVTAKIDGVIDEACAVEIESRTDKQIRGALVDLVFHPFRKKLLVIVPAHMPDACGTVCHCKAILNAFNRPRNFWVVDLVGTGNDPNPDEDEWRLLKGLRRLHLL